MYITRDKIHLKNYGIDNFITYIENNKSIKLKFNFNDHKFMEKFKKAFDALCNKEGTLTYRTIKKELYDALNLRHRCDWRSIESYIERGFTKEDHDMDNKNRQIEKINEFLQKNKTFTIKVGKYSYQSENVPICSFCGSQLNLRLNEKSIEVLSCSNEVCPSNTSSKSRTTLRNLVSDSALKNNILLHNKKNNRLCVEYYIEKGFDEEYAKKEISKIQKEYSKKVVNRFKLSKKNMLNKINNENEVDLFFKKRSVLCKEYWMYKGLSEEESIKKVSDLQKANALKYAEKRKDKNKYPDYKINSKTIEYWTHKGLSEEDAKNKLSENQRTFTKDKCIAKYGYEKGLEIWEERQIKWQKSLHKNGNMTVGFSKISQTLFDDITKHYDIEDIDYIFYASKNKEYNIHEENKNYLFDFCDLKRRKIIEFNGDIYHANKQMFNENDSPNPFTNMTSKEIWARDENKINVAIKNGFDVMVIWEKEYRDNPNELLNKALNFLLNE